MQSFKIGPNSARQAKVQANTNTGIDSDLKSNDLRGSHIEIQERHKGPVTINPGIRKAESFTTKSVQNRHILDMERINRGTNTIAKSHKGKTSGVFLVTDPVVGTVVAVVKPVKDPEIFANKLFGILGMPIPRFSIVGEADFSSAIREKIDTHPAASSASENNLVMVMEPILGRAMSEYDAEELKSLLLIDRNLELLGLSMALDVFAGNADRIVPFSANIVNPDNIMFRDNSVVFIDQAFKIRSSQKERIFSGLADAVNPADDRTKNNNSVYIKYIVPLIKRSLQKYQADKSEEISATNESPVQNNLFETFESLIDADQKYRINKITTSGICKAVQLLIDHKREVLDLCDRDQSRKTDIIETYVALEKIIYRFKENKS